MENSTKTKITNWILRHDDCKIFIVLYISMAVLLTLLFSLFWLVIVVGIHFSLEVFRQYYLCKSKRLALLNSIYETKLDIALILFAFALDVYMDLIFGLAGISAGARGLAQTGSRIAVWQRIIRGFFISLDDLVQVVRFTKGKKKKSIENDKPEKANLWLGKWSVGDILSFSFGVVMLVLIFSAPAITHHSYSDVFRIIAEEMHPFP